MDYSDKRPVVADGSRVTFGRVSISFVLLAAGVVAAALQWSEHPPAIAMGDRERPYILWNDPSVIEENGAYRMWLSGGDARNLDRIEVSVYEGASPDGRAWKLNYNPVLRPSPNPLAWDGLRIETPSVVRAGHVYHLYYTGFNESSAKTGISQIGHATSIDGVNWVKDLRNPILKGQTLNRQEWGYGGVGEPGVVFDAKSGLFYLYYVGLRYSPANPSIGQIGILLAVSRDGSDFTPVQDRVGRRRLILTRDVPGAIDGAWFGYSTPAPYMTRDGQIHMAVSFLVAPKGPATARHVTIDRAESSNGVDFTVREFSIVTAGKGDWKDAQVRAPTVLDTPSGLHLWFAGERHAPFFAGIGLLSRVAPGR